MTIRKYILFTNPNVNWKFKINMTIINSSNGQFDHKSQIRTLIMRQR